MENHGSPGGFISLKPPMSTSQGSRPIGSRPINSVATMSESQSYKTYSPQPVYQGPQCNGCGKTLYDRWLLEVGDQLYHMSCLRCCACLRTLDSQTSCYVKDNEVFCKYHYQSRFGPKCSACSDVLSPTDWVRRESGLIYHVDCFSCRTCKRTLNTGDHYVIRNSMVYCPDHYETTSCIVIEDDNVSVSSVDSDVYGSENGSEKSQPDKRRKRANFTPQQLEILHAAFARNPCPSSEEIELISESVNHTTRVVQVWFQNSRTRNRKRKEELDPYKKPKKTAQYHPQNMASSRISDSCHWIANPCSPDTIPFME